MSTRQTAVTEIPGRVGPGRRPCFPPLSGHGTVSMPVNIYLVVGCGLSGCIYSYDAEHPIGGKRFTELDPPNFFGSFYSYTKGLVEKLLLPYDNLLILRLRMPISADLSDRNFITKISRYARVRGTGCDSFAFDCRVSAHCRERPQSANRCL